MSIGFKKILRPQLLLVLFILLQPFSAAYAQQAAPEAHFVAGLCKVLALAQGAYGSMLMVLAGLIAMVTAAMGAYKSCLSVIVVGAGTWILGPIITIFVGTANCQSLTFQAVLPTGGIN